MNNPVCPWYVGYLLANPLRRLIHHPEKIFGPYVKAGMSVLEVGPGMGFFSLPLARLVGEYGHVVCVDVQERMIRALKQRAAKAGLLDRIESRVCTSTSLQVDDLAQEMDLALAVAVVHEVPDAKHLLVEIHRSLKHQGVLILSEPAGHVTADEFARTCSTAEGVGFAVLGSLKIRQSHSVVLAKR